MRWNGQAITHDDGALPGLELPGLRTAGLLRTVRSPDFAGVTFHEVLAKSALSKVPAASQMPFRWTVNPYRGCSHACTYCVDPSTLVLMADGGQKAIRDIVVGDRIVGTKRDGAYRRYVETEVQAHWGTTKHAYRVTLEDGTEIVASGDHRFLTERGWKYVAPLPSGERQRSYLTTNNQLQGFGQGMVAEAYTSPPESRLKIIGAAVKTSLSLRIVSVENLGTDSEMVDITTGTGDFIANGVISHNCFARPTHEYLDLDAGHDFDSQVVVKVNADQVLRAELAKPSWTHEPVALGTNTDPYQRAEGRYKLMPGIISALADSGTPFSILTKGTLLRRDLPLLTRAAEKVDVGLGVSLAFADSPAGKELQHAVEPGTPSPRARLDLIRAIRAAGLPCGVMVAPVLPWLTDYLAHLERLLDALVDAGATGVTVLPLHLRPGAREWYLGWLERDHPHLVEGYGRVYARGAYAHKGYRDWLWERVRPLLDERGLGGAAMHRAGADQGDQHAEGDYPRGAFGGVRADGTGAASLAGDVGSETLF
ncbi:intein [Promicromonospora sp. AC04]|uniref:Rv2578c family radical SAM protein n=1 Tax=Promicromonospora sp. AC04 TaxID=2135723 RepID=UPI000D3BABDC|nr:Rv2578c family radical SAM protein [Promicromonospora sp. AC04]PUB25419.1 intein [Promicromonospora sp. AC04]